jgi:hypothetical protein
MTSHLRTRIRQLDAAERLGQRLLAAAVRAAQVGSGAAASASGGPDGDDLPLQVAAHYLRTLVEWVATQILSKAAAAQQQGKGGRGAAPAAVGRDSEARRHPREEPRSWALLAHALEAGAPLLQGAAVASPSLSTAAAAACEAAAQWRDAACGAALASALQRALRVLGQQHGLWYRPTLEQQMALLGAVLAVRCAHSGLITVGCSGPSCLTDVAADAGTAFCAGAVHPQVKAGKRRSGRA